MSIGIVKIRSNITVSTHQQRTAFCIARTTGIITCIILAFFAGSYSQGKYSFRNYDPSTNESVESKLFGKNKNHSSFDPLSSHLPSSPVPPTSSLSSQISTKSPHEYFDFSEIVQKFALAKVYQSPISPSDQSWCTTEPYAKVLRKTRPTGILYNKMPKAASSTMAGITLRIAHRVASRIYGDESVCTNRFTHIMGLNRPGELFSNRDRSRSFLFSTLRDPAKRAFSRILFSHGKAVEKRKQKEDKSNVGLADSFILQSLNTTEISHQFGVSDIKRGGFQVAYTIMNVSDELSVYDPSHPAEVSNLDHALSMVRQILNDYDFMIIVERFDECIVLMQLLLGLETSDIMYLSAKKSGGYYDEKGKCKKTIKSDLSPRVSEFLSSKNWLAMNYADYLLIEAASQSIDLTIDAIGRKRFEEAFEAFQTLKKRALRQCEEEAIFPCSSTGHLQEERSESNCYYKDAGCGYPCLDAMTP